MSNQISDGWHKIYGYEVYVEDGYITRAMTSDHNGHKVAAYPYRAGKDGGWWNDLGLSVEAFRAGVRRGTIRVF